MRKCLLDQPRKRFGVTGSGTPFDEAVAVARSGLAAPTLDRGAAGSSTILCHREAIAKTCR